MNFLSDCQIISQPAQEIFYQFGKTSLVLLNPKHSIAVLLSSPETFHMNEENYLQYCFMEIASWT